MAELIPIDEMIVQNVIAVIGAVRAGSTYASTLKAKAPAQSSEGDVITHGLAIVTHDGVVRGSGLVAGHDVNVLHLGVTVYAVLSETYPDGTVRKRLSQFAADVKKALLVDRDRGGYAINTRFAMTANASRQAPDDPQPDEFNELESPPSVTVHVSIDYWTRWDDPYTN